MIFSITLEILWFRNPLILNINTKSVPTGTCLILKYTFQDISDLFIKKLCITFLNEIIKD
jgi:hypothetical protein